MDDNRTADDDPSTRQPGKLLHEKITQSIIAAFFAVYDKLGFGFLERIYKSALEIELRRRGHKVAREVPVEVWYDGFTIGRFVMDFVVDDLIVLETKSRFVLSPTDRPQLLNYLRATRFDVGLLLHFGPKPKFYRLLATDHFERLQ
ncbi:MAG TPA: GxxExxY protein [Gemmatimonadaceae bacterium]